MFLICLVLVSGDGAAACSTVEAEALKVVVLVWVVFFFSLWLEVRYCICWYSVRGT